jgi:hypothetical protein
MQLLFELQLPHAASCSRPLMLPLVGSRYLTGVLPQKPHWQASADCPRTLLAQLLLQATLI